jgi:hypothetical protein
MHMRGRSMSMEAIYPDGRKEVLSAVNRFQWNWHVNYVYADHVAPLLPKGTVLVFTAWHDNTAKNPNNPDPRQWVGWGDRTVDEMAHAWVDVTYLDQPSSSVSSASARPPSRSGSSPEDSSRIADDRASVKAVVCHQYGSVAVEEIERPALPDGAVLVRVRAVALNTIDWFLAMGKPYFARLMAGGVRRPRSHVVGREFAGTVEAVGGNVTQLRAGDEVFGAASGSLAEYVAAPAERVARKPTRVSFEQAAG